MHALAAYNVHKRATLDRVTGTFRLKTLSILRADAGERVDEFVRALNVGRESIHPDVSSLRGRLSSIFEAHRERVIYVAVSDGIQEITPDHRLNLWQNHPIMMPVELTLDVALASRRDKLAEALKAKTIKKNTYKVGDLVTDTLEHYLDALKKSFRVIARKWFAGESDEADVIRAIKFGLQVTDRKAHGILRTETTNYFNETRQSYFQDNTATDYVELYAVTDGRISEICEARHGAVVTIEEARLRKYMPAFHPNCRTIQRPLISAVSDHKRIIDAGLAMRARTEPSWPKAAWAA